MCYSIAKPGELTTQWPGPTNDHCSRVSKRIGAALCISLAAVVVVGALGGFGGVGNATSAAGSRLQEAVGTRSPDPYPQAAAVAVDGNPLPDFSLYVKPSSPVSAGGHSSNRITVTSIHQFTGRVRLAVRALPTGWGATIVPSSILAGHSAIARLSVPADAISGRYTLEIAGESHDGVNLATLTVVVRLARYQATPSYSTWLTSLVAPRSRTRSTTRMSFTCSSAASAAGFSTATMHTSEWFTTISGEVAINRAR